MSKSVRWWIPASAGMTTDYSTIAREGRSHGECAAHATGLEKPKAITMASAIVRRPHGENHRFS